MNPLGQTTEYKSTYDPGLLFPISRSTGRQRIGLNGMPFHGIDAWTAYEFSCLNEEGKPLVAVCNFTFHCFSEFLIESKSLKLYLNSFNNSRFKDLDLVRNIIEADLSAILKSEVKVWFDNPPPISFTATEKGNLDLIELKNVEIEKYNPDYLILKSDNKKSETLFSSLLKSNCPVTKQPDWATISIKYEGKEIDHEGLLRYILSFRNHNEFHEECVERIFWDVYQRLKPKKLTVFARYTRRGGIDINPDRSNCECLTSFKRTSRQ